MKNEFKWLIGILALVLFGYLAKDVKREPKEPEYPNWAKIDSTRASEKARIQQKVEEFRNEENNNHIKRLERIIELKDKAYCKSPSDVLPFLTIVNETREILKIGPETELLEPARKALKAFQIKNFPLARKQYYLNSKSELWKNDIEVSMSGKTIGYISFRYSLNEDKMFGYNSVKSELEQLRFKKVYFASVEGYDNAYWNISSKNDSDIF